MFRDGVVRIVSSANQILSLIGSVHAAKRRVPTEVAGRLAEHFGEDGLTTRKLDVVRLIRDGH